SADVLAAGGLVVETTLNTTWQEAAEAAVAKTLKNKGRWQNFKTTETDHPRLPRFGV
ncbi:MAG: hypothetical protein F6K62_26855, partial [Sphaerospermopsis sp. SIO1G2]|nr:hypothetical protein [Sphaerospermopsis sp. SIO1G2]